MRPGHTLARESIGRRGTSTHRRMWRGVALAAGALVASMLTIGQSGTASAADPLISQDKAASASSVENGGTPAYAAFDGSDTTRWASAFSDNQWLQIDLGATATISKVTLMWETAYAKSFQVQTSADGNTWTSVYSTTTGTGGTQNLALSASGRFVRMLGTVRGTQYGYSLYEFQVYGVLPPETGTYVLANPQVTGVTPSQYTPPNAYFHEFQANCSVNHELPDDPIVFPNQPGASHMHTFMGNSSTNAATTLTTLEAGGTACLAPGDKSGYWMPTMYNGSQMILPVGPQVIYYKTNLIDYTSVRPFPPGLRFLVGSPAQTESQFQNLPGTVEGWECGDSYYNWDFPATCPAGTQLNIRLQAPSCWNGLYLDTPDHKSHMAYPVNGRCPADHPVALPMIEFKMAFPVSGDLSQLRLSSGRGFSFHFDFFNDWDVATQAAMVTHCVDGGLQCDARGYDQEHPEKGAVLDQNYQLIH
jgi:hypothetical protein